MPMKKIYDCFIFFNEIEILKTRFQELYDVVDFFVICEATVTFQGKPKPLYFDLHAAEFTAFADKIIRVIVDDMPVAEAHTSPDEIKEHDPVIWNREHFQRNALRRGLGHAEPDDVIIISDSDEIIHPSAIEYIRNHSGYFLLDMPMYQFFMNMCAQESGWRKPFAYSYALDADIPDYNHVRTNERTSFELFEGRNHYLENAGWHFTFLGGAQQVKNKLMAYSHTEGWQRRMWNDDVLGDQMIALREVGGSKALRYCRVDHRFPITVQNDLTRYIEIGFVKDEWTRLKELESLWSAADAHHHKIMQVHNQAVRQLNALQRALRSKGVELASQINLIATSRDFAMEWNRGMQSQAPVIDPAVPEMMPGNAVMRHMRDAEGETRDANIGYFSHIPVEAGRVYVTSCWVFLPEAFSGRGVDLSLDSWQTQTKTIANPSLRSQWQRISTFGTAPPGAVGCNIVLRAHAKVPCTLYSTCWQVEEGEIPTQYCATNLPPINPTV